MDVDKNSTSYREQERESGSGLAGEAATAREGAGPGTALGFRLGMEFSPRGGEWGAREYALRGMEVRKERGVLGAHPHLVQLVLEHF